MLTMGGTILRLKSCSLCPAGFYCPEISFDATPCPAGSFSTAGATNCTPCPPGSFSPSMGSSSCQPCFIGAYCPGSTTAGAANCTPCPPGSFSPSVGSSSCQQCPVGAYCAGSGALNVSCSPASACPSTGISAVSGRLWSTGVNSFGLPTSGIEMHWKMALGGGKYVISPGPFTFPSIHYAGYPWYSIPSQMKASWIGSATFPSGWTSFVLNFSATVGFTFGGKFANDNDSGALLLFPQNLSTALPATGFAAPGSFTSSSDSSTTTVAFTMINNAIPGGFMVYFSSLVLRCPSGFYSNITSSTPLQAACFPCPTGFYCAAGAAILCPAGSYCPLHSINATLCPTGLYSNAGATKCLPCPGGHFCPLGTSSWSQFNCGKGNYCPDGSASPRPCPMQMPPSGAWGVQQVQGPAFLVETASCLSHCFFNFSSGSGLSSC